MKPFRSSLGWRLYALGVVQLVLVAGAVVLIDLVVHHLAERTDMGAVASQIRPLLGDAGALTRELNELHARQGVLLSVYDDSRRLVATNVTPALPMPRWGRDEGHGPGPPPDAMRFTGPPPPPPDGLFPGPPLFEPPAFRHGPPGARGDHPHGPPDMFVRLEFANGDGLLVARAPPPQRTVPWLFALFSGLVVAAAGAYLTTRWITRPLAELTRAARALGGGDLSARTGLHRPDEIGELGRVFDEMAARMSELLMAEKELLANVSHELRTPLARIRVALEIAGEGDALTARTSLAEIAVDLAELEALIDDVLAATRLAVESRKAAPAGFALHREEIAPRALCERAAERFHSMHPERPLEVVIDGELPTLVVDATLFRRVLDNLLANAHKYSPEPALKILLRAAATDQSGDGVAFEVTDHGMGIAEEDLPRIFDPFFRSERSRSRGTGGVGLGLTLAKRIVEAHGGEMTVESTKDGTTVRATLPVGKAPISG
jgi:signal transduction histidine kinase